MVNQNTISDKKEPEKVKEIIKDVLNKGEKVEVVVENKILTGEVWSIYNDGDTVNVLLSNNKIQPWYRGFVRKVII